jgi:PAS domain S-box-containing protein
MNDQPIHLLMIEDDIVDVMAFKRMVKREQLNYNYQVTESIAEAKQLMEQHRFDIVVTDYQLVDGVFFDLFDTFIQYDIPFICVTGAGDQEIAVKALKAGAYDYLIKDQDRKYLNIFPLTIEKATQRKKSEEQINLLQSIVINSNDGIIVGSVDGKMFPITYANEAFYEMTGYAKDELIGQSTIIFHGEKTLAADKEVIIDAIIKRKDLKKEIILYKKDGNWFWASLSLVALTNKNTKNNAFQFVIMVRDVTSQKEAEAEIIKAKNIAEQAQLAEQRFLANISHEIRTPMNAIMGMASLMHNTSLSAKQLEYLQNVEIASDDLMRLISDVLDSSKMEAGELKLYEQEFNLFEILFDLQQRFSVKLGTKNIQMVMDVDLDIANNLLGDAVRLNQILTNLFEYAARFTEQGEIGIKIILKAERDNLYDLEFQVFDTGIGMPQKEVEIIFNHFKQADQRIYRKFGSSVLGLSVAKKLIELQKGKIWVESAPHQGTTFFFTLTFKNSGIPSSILEEDDTTESQYKKILRHLRFLIVEDNPMNQKIASEMVGYWGCDYHIAHNGLEAIKLFEQNSYDIILMDINMPVMDGYEATSHIRNHEWALNKDIPIIALTAAMLSSEVDKMFEIGINHYITKPINPKEFRNTILQIVSNSGVLPLEVQSKVAITSAESTDIGAFEKSEITIDLEYLTNFSGGDKGFMTEMMTMFIHQVQEEAVQMLDLLRSESWAELGKLAHKMKPNFLMMGLTKQQLMAKEIETLCKIGDFDTDYVSRLTEQLVEDAIQSLPLIEEAMRTIGQ